LNPKPFEPGMRGLGFNSRLFPTTQNQAEYDLDEGIFGLQTSSRSDRFKPGLDRLRGGQSCAAGLNRSRGEHKRPSTLLRRSGLILRRVQTCAAGLRPCKGAPCRHRSLAAAPSLRLRAVVPSLLCICLPNFARASPRPSHDNTHLVVRESALAATIARRGAARFRVDSPTSRPRRHRSAGPL